MAKEVQNDQKEVQNKNMTTVRQKMTKNRYEITQNNIAQGTLQYIGVMGDFICLCPLTHFLIIDQLFPHVRCIYTFWC